MPVCSMLLPSSALYSYQNHKNDNMSKFNETTPWGLTYDVQLLGVVLLQKNGSVLLVSIHHLSFFWPSSDNTTSSSRAVNYYYSEALMASAVVRVFRSRLLSSKPSLEMQILMRPYDEHLHCSVWSSTLRWISVVFPFVLIQDVSSNLPPFLNPLWFVTALVNKLVPWCA